MHRILLIAIVVALLGAAPSPPEKAPSAIVLTPAEKAKVYDTEVVLREIPNPGKPGTTCEAIALLHGTLDQVHAVLVDFERCAEFMPNVTKTEVLERKDQSATVNFTLKLPLGKIKKYRLNLWSERSENRLRLFWKKVPWEGLTESETIADTTGSWLVEPSDREGYLVARYHVYTDPGKVPTGLGWIVNILSKDSLPDILKTTRNRIETLYYSKQE